MIKIVAASLFLCLSAYTSPLLGQYSSGDTIIAPEFQEMVEGESRDIPCPRWLNDEVFDYQPVEHEGHRFWSEWKSESLAYPLPSLNWYFAYPDPDPVSDDERAIWRNARVRVRCWVYRAHWLLRTHYHVVERSGSVVANCDRTGGGEMLWADSYDPYVSGAPQSFTSEDCGRHGGGGGADCTWVYTEIEISYNGGQRWDMLWSGYACQTQ